MFVCGGEGKGDVRTCRVIPLKTLVCLEVMVPAVAAILIITRSLFYVALKMCFCVQYKKRTCTTGAPV